MKGTREPFRFAICSECVSAYNLDFPQNISAYYEGYYSFGEDTLTLEQSWRKRAAVGLYAALIVRTGLSRTLRGIFRCPTPRQMRFLSPNLQAFLFVGAKADARILDVGSGRGQFVRMMKTFGYRNAVGIDPFLDPNAELAYVKRRGLDEEEQRYDVILFNHSLEHTTDPEGSLRRCGSLLAEDGVVVVQVPNMQAKELKEFKENWCWLHAPYHFAIPSEIGLKMMAKRCGFRMVEAVCTSRFDHYLYHDEYRRDIGDRDIRSERRKLEDGSFNPQRWRSLSRFAYSLNREMAGDWVAYYLVRE